MTHDCEDHGHYCSICEEQKRLRQDINDAIGFAENCNWNLSIFDVYDELKRQEQWWQILALTTCFHYFNNDDTKKQFRDLLYHLCDLSVVDAEAELAAMGYDTKLIKECRDETNHSR